MKNYENFTKEKMLYLYKVTKPIKYKKLRDRIYFELSNHIDDMFCDFIDSGMSEEDATEKFLNEMGDPDDLGLKLKEANKKTLRIVKTFKATLALSIIPALIFCQTVGYDFFSDLRTYYQATDIETKEIRIIEKYNDGNPIKLLFETEIDGIVHKYYLPEKQSENSDIYFHTQSIKVLGVSVKDKFVEYGRSTGPLDNEFIIQLNPSVHLNDSYLVLTAPADYKYVRFKFQYNDLSVTDESRAFWGDYIEVPQNITYENPLVIFIDCPDGCYWFRREFYNENKEAVTPTIVDSNRQWSSSTTF